MAGGDDRSPVLWYAGVTPARLLAGEPTPDDDEDEDEDNEDDDAPELLVASSLPPPSDCSARTVMPLRDAPCRPICQVDGACPPAWVLSGSMAIPRLGVPAAHWATSTPMSKLTVRVAPLPARRPGTAWLQSTAGRRSYGWAAPPCQSAVTRQARSTA